MKRIAVVCLIGISSRSLEATEPEPQDRSGGDQTVKIISLRSQGSGYRLTLASQQEAKEGTVFLVRIQPMSYQASGETAQLVLTSSGVAGHTIRTQLERGTVKTAVDLTRPHGYEVRLTLSSDVGGHSPPAQAAVIFLHDPETAEARLRREAHLLSQQLKRVEAFITALEPYGKADGAVVPWKLRERLWELKGGVQSWAEQTDFAAAAGFLTKWLHRLDISLPWEFKGAAEGNSTVGGGPARVVSPRPGVEKRMPDASELKEKVRQTGEIAIREAVLNGLWPLEEALHAVKVRDREPVSEAVRRSLKALGDVFSCLTSHELAGFARAYEPIQEVTALMADVTKAIGSIPIPPAEAGSLTEVQETLLKRLGELRKKVAQSDAR